MFRSTRKHFTVAIAVWTAAISLGAGLAFAAASHPGAAPAAAANHCTRYNPVDTVDFNCLVWQNPMNAIDTTNSVAKRDNNHISMAASRTWELFYERTNNTFFGYKTGVSSSGTQTSGSGTEYVYSECTVNNPSVNGECDTNWHD